LSYHGWPHEITSLYVLILTLQTTDRF